MSGAHNISILAVTKLRCIRHGDLLLVTIPVIMILHSYLPASVACLRDLPAVVVVVGPVDLLVIKLKCILFNEDIGYMHLSYV